MAALCLALLFFAGARAAMTPLVTGNGHGYAVVSLKGAVTSFYAHPYSTEKSAPAGEECAVRVSQLLTSAKWSTQGRARVSYLEESNIVRVEQGAATAWFFLPFGLERNVLVAASDDAQATLDVQWSEKAEDENVVTVELAPRVTALLVVDEEDEIAALAELRAWHGDLSAAELVKRELAAFERWREPAPACARGRRERLWRQSETILRMAQIREASTSSRAAYGLLNASLPEGEFFVPFVRDMAYAMTALIDSGHRAEARAAATAYFEARPIGVNLHSVRGYAYQISTVRYFGNGGEEADRSGEAEPNLELDNWGLALWVSGRYFERFHDVAWLRSRTYRGSIYETMRDYVVRPLVGNLVPVKDGAIVAPDSSVWEQNDEPRKHYAFSTITAIAGLRAFARIAKAMGDIAAESDARENVALLERGFSAAFVRGGHLRGTLENHRRNDMDGALLEAINMDVVRDPAMRHRILERMELLRMPSGGYRRTLGSTDYEKQEFLLVDFNLARAYLRVGETAKADAIVRRITRKALHDNGLIPEMYHSQKTDEFHGGLGYPAGAVPMVGYGAGAFGLYLSERETYALGAPIID